MNNEKGVWRTVGGRRIFIKDGESLESAMKNSGKFKPMKSNKDTDAGNNSSDSSISRKRALLKYKLLKEKALAEKVRQNEIKANFERLKEKHANAIKTLSSDNYADGTYDVDTLKSISYDKGYQVTFSQIGDDYDADTYYNLCSEFLRYSTDGKVCAGKFESTPEVSFNVKDRDTAIALAKKYNQISIWDWANADEIKTGGNGRRLGR